MLVPKIISHEISDCAHWADRLVRTELFAGIIASENDYTSNFTAALRREVNARAIPGLTAQSFVLKSAQERRYGTDACIVIANGSEHKVCLFEAKWPRLSTRQDCWDYLQSSSGNSHFHDQLKRQAAFADRYAIWEMFYCEYELQKQPVFFPNFGSACVWHKYASAVDGRRPDKKLAWTDIELQAMLTTHTVDIKKIIASVCECKEGTPIKGTDFNRSLGDYPSIQSGLLINYSGGK